RSHGQRHAVSRGRQARALDNCDRVCNLHLRLERINLSGHTGKKTEAVCLILPSTSHPICHAELPHRGGGTRVCEESTISSNGRFLVASLHRNDKCYRKGYTLG